jgi:hypothetical protein
MHGSRRHIIMHRHERVAAAAQACGCHKVCQRSSAGASRLHGMAHIGEAVVDETRRIFSLPPVLRSSRPWQPATCTTLNQILARK